MLTYGGAKSQTVDSIPHFTLKEKALYYIAYLLAPGVLATLLTYLFTLAFSIDYPLFIQLWFGFNPTDLRLLFVLIDLLYFSDITFISSHMLILLLYPLTYFFLSFFLRNIIHWFAFHCIHTFFSLF